MIGILKVGTARRVVEEEGAGDFEDWIAAGLGADTQVVTIDIVAGEALPDARALAGVVVTGSSAMVTEREEWSEGCGRWLAEAARQSLAVLGICYGHQLLADALGGTVGDEPNGREIGTANVTLTAAATEDRLFETLPRRCDVQETHSQSVLALPPGATLLATGVHTRIQAFRWGATVWGVQFHPEFGPEITAHYIRARCEALQAEGLDPEERLAGIRPSPAAWELLARFAALAGGSP